MKILFQLSVQLQVVRVNKSDNSANFFFWEKCLNVLFDLSVRLQVVRATHFSIASGLEALLRLSILYFRISGFCPIFFWLAAVLFFNRKWCEACFASVKK